MGAVARHCREQGRPLRLLWFDAHGDYNTASITPSGNMHGMPVAVLTGHGPSELVEMAGAVPALAPGDVRQIGLRDVDLGEKHLLHEHRIEVFDMRYLDEVGVREAMRMALDDLRAQPGPRRAERDRAARGGPGREPLRQEHPATRASLARVASR